MRCLIVVEGTGIFSLPPGTLRAATVSWDGTMAGPVYVTTGSPTPIRCAVDVGVGMKSDNVIAYGYADAAPGSSRTELNFKISENHSFQLGADSGNSIVGLFEVDTLK